MGNKPSRGVLMSDEAHNPTSKPQGKPEEPDEFYRIDGCEWPGKASRWPAVLFTVCLIGGLALALLA